jgi:hypothetical protein
MSTRIAAAALLSGAGFSPSIDSVFRVFGASEGRHLHG